MTHAAKHDGDALWTYAQTGDLDAVEKWLAVREEHKGHWLAIALRIAILNDHVDVVRALMRKIQIYDNNNKNHYLINDAVRGGHTSIMQLLVEAKAHLNAQPPRRCGPLHIAASRGHIDAAQLLLEMKADVNPPFPILHHAIAHDDVVMMELLVRAKADTNRRVALQTPLEFAIKHHKHMSAAFLLRNANKA